MQPFEVRIIREFAGRMMDMINDAENALILGQAHDYADYRHRVGLIAGMRTSIEEAREAERALLGDTQEKA